MCRHKYLSLRYRVKFPHPPLSYAGRLMGLLCPIILILLSAMDRLRNQFLMSNAIAAQFFGYDLPRLVAMASYQSKDDWRDQKQG